MVHGGQSSLRPSERLDQHPQHPSSRIGSSTRPFVPLGQSHVIQTVDATSSAKTAQPNVNARRVSVSDHSASPKPTKLPAPKSTASKQSGKSSISVDPLAPVNFARGPGPLSPSESPQVRTAAPQIRFDIGQRPQLELDIDVPRKPVEDLFATPSSASPERRRSSTFDLFDRVPIRPRKQRKTYDAKLFVPRSFLEQDASTQYQEILKTCDRDRIPVQDVSRLDDKVRFRKLPSHELLVIQ